MVLSYCSSSWKDQPHSQQHNQVEEDQIEAFISAAICRDTKSIVSLTWNRLATETAQDPQLRQGYEVPPMKLGPPKYLTPPSIHIVKGSPNNCPPPEIMKFLKVPPGKYSTDTGLIC